MDAISVGLDGMSFTLERLPGLIDNAEAAAYSAGSEAEDAQRDIQDVLHRLAQLERNLAERLNRTPDFVFLRLRHTRSRVWNCFNVDRLLKPSKAAEKLAPRLLAHLNEPLDFSAYLMNLARLQHWEKALEERERPGSTRRWSGALKGALDIPADVGQRHLVDDLDGVREKWQTAKKWRDLEGIEMSADEF